METTPEELALQQAAMARVAARNAALPRIQRAYVDTYGCQQNESDSELIRGMLAEMGYEPAASEHEADVIVINTCSVREHAETRVIGNIGALVHEKERDPDVVVAVCGCMAQRPEMAEKLKRSYRCVDLVFGNLALWRFPELLERVLDTRKRVFEVPETDGVITEGLPIRRSGSVKAWLPVMYGCNNFCSYCIVPYVRGRERSRRPEEVVAEAERIIAAGYKDITLLGQNVNSYGRDLDAPVDFSDLLAAIAAKEGDFLLRFMTSNPKDAGEKLFRTMASSPRIAHQLHLPFQSGSDRILKQMNRHYTHESYLALVETARRWMPDVVLTSDVIVGFPGETEEDFEETLRLIREVRFDALFTFIYSKRSGTPAATMPDPVTRAEKQVRFDRLTAAQDAISGAKHAAYVGTVQRVLVDGLSGNDDYPLTSRTGGGRLVHLRGDASLVGRYVDAEITGYNTWALSGHVK